MKRIGIMFLVGGGLWILAVGTAHAESWRHGHHPSYPRVQERFETSVKGRAAGAVSFETLRMLSTGMTKAEVLSKAGAPRHSFKDRGTQRWIYASSDHWIVEIVFSGNNVITINWSRA
ncbi:MAG: hypothetical protein EPO02_07995 [Nitrospirae bacterium]|nr:MAG: hypothetical protein EPO02_07995 [Nitrospirota bacterium]